MFITGEGPVTVKFFGTTEWELEEYCDAQRCEWHAWADMYPGDEIWGYSVWAIYSEHVSAYCYAVASPSQEVTLSQERQMDRAVPRGSLKLIMAEP